MIELDKNIILWALFSMLLGALAVVSFIGIIRREVYIGGTKREGVAAVIWGIGYFLILATFASTPILMFKDYGYSKETMMGWSAAVLITSILFGFFWEKFIRQNYLPTYEEEDAKNVTFKNLPQNIQVNLSKDDVLNILNLEFEYQLSKNWQQIDEAAMRAFIIRKMSEKGRNLTDEAVQAVIKAEEVYLKQIGILSNKRDQGRNEQKPKQYSSGVLTPLLGTGVWRVITVIIILGVIIFGRYTIIGWFNDVFFIKEDILTEKMPIKTTLDRVGYFNILQLDYPKYAKSNDLNALTKVAFAQYFLDKKELDRAIIYIQKAMNKDDKYLPALIVYGDYLLYYKNNYDEALKQYQIAETIDRTDPTLNARLGDIYYNYLGEKEKGINYYNKALEINPKYGEVYGYFIAVYTQKGQYEKAIESYHKALRYGTGKAVVYYNAALAYKALNNLDEAERVTKISLDKNPRNVDTHILEAELYEQEGNLDKAIKLMEKIALSYPKAINAYNYLGNLYVVKGLYQQAIKTYENAVSIESDQKSKAIIYENLGLVYHNHTRQFDLAEEAFKDAIKYNPKQATTYINLGETYRVKGMLKEAAAQQRIALQLDPQNALAHNNLGYDLALQGNITEAILEFKKALQIDPDLKIAKENLDNFQKK